MDYEEQRRLREAAAVRNSAQSRQNQPPRRRPPQTMESAEVYRLQPRGKAAAIRRKRIVKRQRLAVGLWALCVLIVTVVVITEKANAAPSDGQNPSSPSMESEGKVDAAPTGGEEILVQGLSAEVFAAHPNWTENFLTPNEYSRPGDALDQVTNIFVHYTANPGTSAAQNRSYFEQQKDTHERSVSAHFIIGYNGEIIQCIPLNEIAYAVQTRNEDSVSIECCYLAEDGSFTGETYDSLIELLAWLTDAYGLDADDILRHYDCGGKKCPVYYTKHEDAWKQLKEDVREMMEDIQTVL